jgi:hypothetical protein
MASGVLGVPYSTPKTKAIQSRLAQSSLAVSLSLGPLLLCALLSLLPHSLLSSLDQDCDCGWQHQHAVGSLAPTSISALRGQRLDSLLDRHPPFYLAMCKPGTHIVAVSSEQGLHSDGVLLQNGGRQMQQGNPASY